MPKIHPVCVFICLGLILFSGFASSAEDAIEGADTRILIDVSGSMKKNDPSNLRRPALRLLVGLLPEDARAGVWTFGQYINMQVPLGKVDKAWKIRARQGAGKIHSRGLFTNIEDVIKKSIDDWQGETSKYRRHLILLTDGMVDISTNAEENAASRARILDQILPQLKAYGAKVHTIALSERADHELMKTLSEETGGWYEQVNDAAQLQRIFLKLFEKVGRPDSVPLRDNRFTIDASISETTLLIFHGDATQLTRVTSPSGSSFGAIDAPANVNWHRDEGYDLLTISQPEVGEWQIQAAADPDNRVMVVTDLKLHSTELPSKLALGERIPLSVHFTEQGRKITERAFLDVVNIQVEQSDGVEPGEPQPLLDNGQQGDQKAGDGSYTMLVGDRQKPGRVELLLDVEGKTFKREQHQSFAVVPSYALEIVGNSGNEQSAAQVRVLPDLELLDPASIAITGAMSSGSSTSQPVLLLPMAEGAGWEAFIERKSLVGTWKLALHLSARTRSGNQLEIDLDPLTIEGQVDPVVSPEPVLQAQKKTVEGEGAPATEPDWVMLLALFGAGNLLLLLMAVGAFWLLKRRGNKEQIQLLDDEDAIEAKGVAG